MKNTIERTARVRLTGRDLRTLNDVGQLRAIRMDDLGRLLGQGHQLAPRTVRAIVNRWKRCGLAQTHRVTAGPSIVTLTTVGSMWARVPTEWPQGLPSWSAIPHTLSTSAVAVAYKVMPNGGQWERPDPRPAHHTPDGVMVQNDFRYAVEVELNRKSSSRWLSIIGQLLDDYPITHYWTTEEVGRSLTQWMDENLPEQDRQRITNYPIGALSR